MFSISCSATGSTSASSIPPSTVERTPLELSLASETPFFEDADGTWINNKSGLDRAMKAFWQKTGVYPYLYIAPNGTMTTAECKAKADEIRETLPDDVHAVLVFCDDNQGGFYYANSVGSTAATVFDQEAGDILANYLNYYYEVADTDTDVFIGAYNSTAERIMHITQPWYIEIAPFVVIIVVAAATAVVVVMVVKRKREKEKHMEEVLSMPLQSFDDLPDDLEKKYMRDE